MEKDEGQKYTQVYVPTELREELRMMAKYEGRTMVELLRRMVADRQRSNEQ